jgi:DoxX-like family
VTIGRTNDELNLGVWKVLGAIAIVLPKFPRLKEWAYAGILFDLTGASASHAACGHPVSEIVTPLVILGIVMASWVLRPESRTLRDASMSPIGLFPPTLPEARLETST